MTYDMKGSLVYRQSGGIVYRQEGGFAADDGSDFATEAPPVIGGVPGGQPPMPPMDQAPVAPPAPAGPPPRMSFAEKVAEAKKVIQRNADSGKPLPTPSSGMGMDAQGDGPVQFGEGAGQYAPGMVGPDAGPDDVDAMLPEGTMVMNAEAAEMYGPELDEMEAAAGPAPYNMGSPAMVRAKLTPRERTLAPHVTQMFRGRLEEMNAGGLAMRNKGGEVYDRQVFIRKLLEEVKPGSRDEALLLKKLDIDPVTRKKDGGEVETPFWEDDRLGQLGESLVAIGQHDFKGAAEALRPQKADKDTLKNIEERKAEVKSFADISRGAQKAYNLVEPAKKAILHYHTVYATASRTAGVSSIIPGVNDEAIDKALQREVSNQMLSWGKKEENAASYRAYTTLRAALRALAAASLDTLGPGPKTDFDFKVIAESIGQLEDTPAGIKATLQRVIDNANEEIIALGGTVPSVESPYETSSAQNAEEGSSEVEGGSLIVRSHEEEAGDLAGTIENLQGKSNYAPVATKIDKSLVPQDVIDFNPKKNRWVQGDDGAYYIHYDAKRADKILAAWYRALEVLPNG